MGELKFTPVFDLLWRKLDQRELRSLCGLDLLYSRFDNK